jgi:hypothetical protein
VSQTDDALYDIGETLVTSRSIDEYEGMFDLDLAALVGCRVLDCPGGGASFVASAHAAGIDAIAVDPTYADEHPEVVAERLRAEAVRSNEWVRAHLDLFAWGTVFDDPDDHLRSRQASVERFVAHRALHPDRYVTGSLPSLPFADGSADLALSSHLLFTYDDRHDEAFHVAAVLELLRVAREVRVFPTLSLDFGRSPLVDPVVDAVQDAGFTVELHRTDYEFQRGGDELLVARHPP